jgi:succinate dehydrogenase / fumarate reductase flavoprotein subunit
MLGHEVYKYDILVIGAGGAGLRAAIAARDSGASVCVVSKSLLGKAHTVMAEGGVAAALGNVEPKDNWQLHFRDTMKSGAYINHWRMVEIFVKDMPSRIFELERWGAVFDRTPQGRVMQRAFGGHSYKRVCHIGDRTGLEMLRTLQDRTVAIGVEVFNDLIITKLLKDGDRIAGAFGYKNDTGNFVLIRANAVILATGGYGRIFKVTSNSWESTGDGVSLAYDLGAELCDMEMVQFHPTGMAYPPSAKGILATEGIRGEGGVLKNIKGERFMKNYDPEKMELSTRDKVSRAIFAEIKAGRGTDHEAVHLDISQKDADFIKNKLPSMYHQFMDLSGVDITKGPMEVAPTAHYAMGGIRVDPETCESNIPGLYAAGEVSNGLHGANRMGGNSMGELLVFGKRAGEQSAEYTKSIEMPNVNFPDLEAEKKRLLAPFERGPNAENPQIILGELQDTMQMNVGLIRNGDGLQTALAKIVELQGRALNVGAKGNRVFNPGWNMAISIVSMLRVSETIVRSAIMRVESRGAHSRTDYTGPDPKLARVNIRIVKEGDGMRLTQTPVPDIPEEFVKLLPEDRK